jgi:hypothetical protein
MLSYCFSDLLSSVDGVALVVGQTAGHELMCSCSPCAIRLHRAKGLVFSPQIKLPTLPQRAVSTTFSPAPSPGAQTSFSQNVGAIFRWWLRILPSSEIKTEAFHKHPRLEGDLSLNPMWAKTRFCKQACWRVLISFPSMSKLSRARWLKRL